ncbi:hypothetical protein [Actinoplanes sp. NPDC048796]|uniref:hypothetical protein n=1 Tax=Actinoplanes sp. NPDC048796 TaxID=3155640 RepID=UPI003407B0B3
MAAGNTRGVTDFLGAIEVRSGSVTDFLGAIEVRYGSEDPDTRNVVEVSFMEDLLVLPDANERAAIDVLHRWAGPRTLAGLIAARTYLHPPGDEPRPAS